MEDDAELVRRALARDQQAFAALYDRYADKLYDYARRQTGNTSDAGDIVQDTFVLAIQRLHQLRDPSLVRPWLYAIARSEVHRRHRRVNKLQFSEPDEQAAMTSGAPTADDLVHQQELRALFAEAANGLDPSDREVLDLHLRHSLTGAEIAATLGIPERQVGVVVRRVRERLGRSIGVVLLAKSPSCVELAALQRTEGTPLTVLSRKRLARHIEGCLTCSQQLSDRMRPEVLLAALPIALAPAFLRNGVLQRMAEVANIAAPGSNPATATSAQPRAPQPNANPSSGPNAQPPGGGRRAPSSSSTPALPHQEGGRVWQTSYGFPRLTSPTRRTALIVGGAAAVLLLVLFGVLIANGGDSAKRLTAGNTTLDAQAILAGSASTTAPAEVGTTAGTTINAATTAPGLLPTIPVATAPPSVRPTNPPATNPTTTSPTTTSPTTTTTGPDTTSPVFQSASANPTDISANYTSGPTCNAYGVTTMITVNVTDDRGVASVTLSYTAGTNQYDAALDNVGGVWQASIGPLDTAQFADGDYPINAQFTATDTAGNTRVSTVNSIAVLHDCIIIT